MKGIECCAECADYYREKHMCLRGCTVDPDLSKGHDVRFYADCPLPEVESVEKPSMSEDDRKKCEEWCKDCEHIEMCRWYPFAGCDFRMLTPKAESPWISCEDRLPLLHQEVIVAVYGSDIIIPEEGEDIIDAVNRSMDTHRNVTVGCLGSDGWYGADGFPMVVRPKFWMPKPDLPKEVQGNE